MNRFIRASILSSVATLTFAVAARQSFAFAAANEAEDATMGTIAITMVDRGGKPAANIPVQVFPPAAENKGVADTVTMDDRMGKPIAEGTTGEDGKVSLKVPAGKYVIRAGAVGMGMTAANVEVKAGKESPVAMKIKAPHRFE